MGDVLWLEPVLNQLSKKHKRVYLYTRFEELFNNYPIKNVFVKPIPPGWFRAILKLLNFISLQKKYYRLDGICYESFPKMHILHAYQQYFNLPLTNIYPKLYLNKQEQENVKELTAKYVIIHLEPNAQLNFRNVYGVSWENIVDHIKNKGYQVVLIGNNPIPIKNATIYKSSIRGLIQIIQHCSFFIGVDSGPSHIAASLQKPSIIFFGSVNLNFRHFTNLFKGFFLQQPCEFAGCYHEVISSQGQPCKLVGNNGIPKCCVHSDELVKNTIDLLLNKYVDHD